SRKHYHGPPRQRRESEIRCSETVRNNFEQLRHLRQAEHCRHSAEFSADCFSKRCPDRRCHFAFVASAIAKTPERVCAHRRNSCGRHFRSERSTKSSPRRHPPS